VGTCLFKQEEKGDRMKKKIAICLVTLLAVLLATPIQAHALIGGTPPTNTVSIDDGTHYAGTSLGQVNAPVYFMNEMSGFTDKTITRVWVYLINMGINANMTLLIYSAEPAAAELALPLVEQAVTLLASEREGWYSFDLDVPFVVPSDTDTLFVGFSMDANTPAGIYFVYDNKENSGEKSFMGFTPDEYTLAQHYTIHDNFMIRAEYLEEDEYTITVTPSDHGTIVADRTHANVEDIINVTVTPDEGYQLVDGSLMFNSSLMNGTSFWMPGEDVVITGEFEQIQYNVDVAPLTHGTIEADKTTAAFEDTVSLIITPEAGYRLAAGSLVYNTTPFTGTEFTMPSEDVLINATFELIPFAISVEADPNGTLGADKELATSGETVTVTVTPNAGYRLVVGSLKYNGIAIEGTTFIMPAASVTITGDFELINQIPNTGDVVNSNAASMMMLLGFALVLGSVKKKKTQK